MSDNTKYIIVKRRGAEKAIILDNYLTHDDLLIPGIISAGFFSFETGEDDCGNPIVKSHAFGESISLGLKSREEVDSKLIDKALNWWVGRY